MKKGYRKHRKCSLVGCKNPHSCKGYCAKHYKHFKNTGRTCSIEGCGERYEAKGLCSVHYVRSRTHGNPLFTKLPRGQGRTFEERFWSRVDKTPGLGPNGDCWGWQGRPNANGYGNVHWEGRPYGTHRVSWFLKYGAWPTGLIRHKCDNPPCCNPSHLLEGTKAENAQDMVERGRQSKGADRPTAKLTESDILAIRNEPKVWGYQSKLAKKYGVGTGTICRIISKFTWKHI